MTRLIVLAVLATLSIPVLVLPQRFSVEPFSSPGVPVLLMFVEILVSATFLKVSYSRNDFVRCVAFGFLLFLVRFLLCVVGSFVDPRVEGLWLPLPYMYPASWWAAAAQYGALLLWVPVVLEKAMPGYFPPRTEAPPAAAPVAVKEESPEQAIVPPSPRSAQPKTFRELEEDLARFPNLLEWMVFTPDRLPMWGSGSGAEMLEAAPEILHRMSEVCKPLLRPEWGRTVRQSIIQTESGYCLVATLPGDFLLSSLWSMESGEGGPPKAVLQEVVESTEHMLRYRFGEMR